MGISGRNFVFRALSPQVLVISSDDVDQFLNQNNFSSFAELLQPFGRDIPIKATLHRDKASSHYLDAIDIRFSDSFALPQPELTDGAMSKWLDLVENVDADDIFKALSNNNDNDNEFDPEILKTNPEKLTPWYYKFRQAWINNSTNFSEHEGFNHPVACLVVTSTSNKSILDTFSTLRSSFHIQSLAGGSYSNPLLVHNVLLHDGRLSEMSEQTLESLFSGVKQQLGNNVTILDLGRERRNADGGDVTSSSTNKVPDIWSNHFSVFGYESGSGSPKNKQGEGEGYGKTLTHEDIKILREAIKAIASKRILPHMEIQLQVLSKETENQRRAITGRLFSVGRKYFSTSNIVSSQKTGTDGEIFYTYSSPEAKLRKLGDYAFMLRDFKFAFTVYHAARRDYESDKAWKCYAGAIEMAGMCKVLTEVSVSSSNPDFDSLFNDAISCYLNKTNKPCLKYAVRTVIFYTALLHSAKLFSILPKAFSRFSSQQLSLPTAMLSEQAALSFLIHYHGPKIRRCIFDLIIAAQYYTKAQRSAYAYRCYRLALDILTSPVTAATSWPGQKENNQTRSTNTLFYDINSKPHPEHLEPQKELPPNWNSIISYLNHCLVQATTLTTTSTAKILETHLPCLLNLLKDDTIEASVQQYHYQRFLDLYTNNYQQSDSSSLGDGEKNSTAFISTTEPVLLNPPVLIVEQSQFRITTSLGQNGDESPMNWTFDHQKPSLVVSKDPNNTTATACAIGERLIATVLLENPLQIEVSLSNITIDCGTESFKNLKISTIGSIIIGPKRSQEVSFTIDVAETPGSISIEGIKFLLSGTVPCFYSLYHKGAPLNDTKLNRINRARSPGKPSTLNVLQQYPNFTIGFAGVPENMKSGEVRKFTLDLKNIGTEAIRQLYVWTSHPSFFHFPNQCCGDKDDSSIYSEVKGSDGGTSIFCNVPNVVNTIAPQRIFLPGYDESKKEGGCLEPGKSTTLSFWIRGDRVGSHDFELFFGCSTHGRADDYLPESIEMRTLKLVYSCLITPSLRINAFVRPSQSNSNHKILGIEVENLDSQQEFNLVQVTSVSRMFKLISMLPKNNGGSALMSSISMIPGKTIYLYYKVEDAHSDHEGESPEDYFTNSLRKLIYNTNQQNADDNNDDDNYGPPDIRLCYTNIPFQNKEIKTVESLLQSYLLKTRIGWKKNFVSKVFPFIPISKYQQTFPLYESRSIDFILMWSSGGGSYQGSDGQRACGHHSITGIDLGTPKDYFSPALIPPKASASMPRVLMAETVQEQRAMISNVKAISKTRASQSDCPIQITLHPASGYSDAVEGQQLNVTMNIANHSWKAAYSWTVELISPSGLGSTVEEEDNQYRHVDSYNNWSWVGQTVFHGTILPNESESIGLKAIVYSLGTLDLNSWRLSYSRIRSPDHYHIKTDDQTANKLATLSVKLGATYVDKSSQAFGVEYPMMPYIISAKQR
ncbi:hypothetical protein H4219_002024 [Mycoemilia scoparia]|uniref:Trafficking protein particle complex 8 n=1 Tax=Mycoemilia scoparia TaxID=417184 RepID=A0A9W8DVA5_9FUNG|nr:hypothetical protein H4219_002024 [Mycoemilia scoparia]